MKPGRELDTLVAEKVMGHDLRPTPFSSVPFDLSAPYQVVPHYSTSIAAAWEVVDMMKTMNLEFACGTVGLSTGFTEMGNGIWAAFGMKNTEFNYVSATTIPEAICLAALKVVGVKV